MKIYYEKDFDTINVYLSTSEGIVSEEVDDNIYKIMDEDTGKVIGYDILDISKRTLDDLSAYIPKEIVEEIMSAVPTDFEKRCQKELDTIMDSIEDESALEAQKMISENIMEVIKVLSKQSHSGLSMGYLKSTLIRLIDGLPLKPLTGRDEEWGEPKMLGGRLTQQNKRYSAVFRYDEDNSTAVNTEGKIFTIDGKNYFTSRDSFIPIKFPYQVPDKPKKVDLSDNPPNCGTSAQQRR